MITVLQEADMGKSKEAGEAEISLIVKLSLHVCALVVQITEVLVCHFS